MNQEDHEMIITQKDKVKYVTINKTMDVTIRNEIKKDHESSYKVGAMKPMPKKS